MKKLLLILLCVPLIGVGQEIGLGFQTSPTSAPGLSLKYKPNEYNSIQAVIVYMKSMSQENYNIIYKKYLDENSYNLMSMSYIDYQLFFSALIGYYKFGFYDTYSQTTILEGDSKIGYALGAGLEYNFESIQKLKFDFGIGLSNISLFENLSSLNNTLYGTNNNSQSIYFTYSFGIHYYLGN
ncbi:MAG: hypothetical protein CMD22_00235 [Flavobacteriales bacterium]|nr:hypothetical protein [Flavobacteriales bacterium]|tara:strand:- start:99 stop:644 length:546 start_codon:yes stop_codon:yes gene_type:complete